MIRACVAALALAAFGCGAPQRPNVILISIDTLRADHVGAYGQPRPTTPALDRIAAAGAVFEQAFAPSPWTLPSHASMLTGLAPARHGLVDVDRVLAPAISTIAEELRAAGVRTGAIVNSAFLGPANGLDRGFERFRHVPETGPRPAAPRMIGEVAAWLDAWQEEPFFLFFHVYDVHSDYIPGPEQRALFVGPYEGPQDGTTAQLRRIRRGEYEPTPADQAHVRDLYAGGVRRTDDALATLYATLDGLDLARDTFVIVTSDHGEELFERGDVLHGRTLYDESIRVPLVVRGPGVAAGSRIAQPATHADLTPTIRALFGLAARDADGIDLGPWLRGEAAPTGRALVAEIAPQRMLDEDRPPRLVAVRTPEAKLIRDLDADRVELYDLVADPGERRDVAAAQPERVAALAPALDAYVAQARAVAEQVELSAEEVERLRALGYAK
jgi:arylsulfatase A-like enzyme